MGRSIYLHRRIKSTGKRIVQVDEKECGRLLRHMLKSVLCCHAHHIIHRDIKPENFMFKGRDPSKSGLKMIDMGLSTHYSTGQATDVDSAERLQEMEESGQDTHQAVGTIA